MLQVILGCAIVGRGVYAASLSAVAGLSAAAGLALLAAVSLTLLVRRSHSPSASVPDLGARRSSRVLGGLLASIGALLVFGGSLGNEPQVPGAAMSIAGLVLVAWGVKVWTGHVNRARRAWRAGATRGLSQAMAACLGLGLPALFLGWAGFVSVGGLRAHPATATALVTHVTHLKVNDYFLRWQLPNGRTATCSTELVDGNPQPGDLITVRYETSHPGTNCQDARYPLTYTLAFVLTGVGLVGMAGAYLIYRRASNSRNSLSGRTPTSAPKDRWSGMGHHTSREA